MTQVNVIGIAPFPGMTIAMEKAAESFSSIDFKAYTGDLMEGVQIAKELDANEIDAIISRGGTALLLKQLISIPVIEIDVSVYDIMRAIRLSSHYEGKTAIVGFPNITERAQVLNDLLDLNMDILSIDSKETTEKIQLNLKANDYEVVIGDQITSAVARKIGLNAILITSVEESITKALEQAKAIGKIRRDTKVQNALLKEIVAKSPLDIFILNDELEEQKIVQTATVPKPLKSLILEKIQHYDREEMEPFKERYNGKIYTIQHKKIKMLGSSFHLFYLLATEITRTKTKAIKQIERDIYENEYVDSFYNSSHSIGEHKKEILRFAQVNNPILIIGEYGTGKDKLAQLIYENSSDSLRLWEINCELMTKTEWKNLLSDYASILQDEGVAIHLKNIHQLDLTEWKQFIHFAKNSLLFKRNKLLFSYVTGEQSDCKMEQKHILSESEEILQYRTPSLRERKTDLPSIATLYINDYNDQYGTQIIGFEPKALERLVNYEWPGNLAQFRRVLKQLMIQSSNSYIQEREVARQIKKEQIDVPIASSSVIQLDQTLEEINDDILTLVLAQEKGNQTQAAKRLGISRSTLWRMLKKFEK